MDTNLKRTNKFKVFLISLCILLPALMVTMIYPRTGHVMDVLRQKYDDEYKESETVWVVDHSLVNYAVEASYYMHGFALQESEKQPVDFTVLDKYGWDSDYHMITSDCEYIGLYNDKVVAGNESLLPLLTEVPDQTQMDEMKEAGILAYLVLEFDAYGKIAISDIHYISNNIKNDGNVYSAAKASAEQYKNNVLWHMASEEVNDGDYERVIPKNFKVVFTIDKKSDFIYAEYNRSTYLTSAENLYLETGAIFIVIAVAVLVAFFALILPFMKRLHTGWERIFCIHIETVCALTILLGFALYGMVYIMAYTNLYEINYYIKHQGPIELLGYALSAESIYKAALTINFLGWTLCFFVEYIVFSAIRQFLSRPLYYLKNRFLFVAIIKWMLSPFKKLYFYIIGIDFKNKMTKLIILVLGINFIIVSILCCLQYLGIIGTIIYSVILFVLLNKVSKKTKQQYESILKATDQMAKGDLKIELQDDLGMFKPVGDSLEQIQQGFSTALEEEAKSQQMKTELITNVSHDLKTPLTAIITYLDLLKNPDISEENRKIYIETLDQKTQRLKILIEDLFQVSKAQTGDIAMDFMDLDVVSLMKQVRLEMEDQIVDSGLLFRWNLPEEKVILNLDGQKTYRVFTNLLNNILKYSLPGSRVFIDIAPGVDDIKILFRNISRSELDFDVERLTDRFVRGDASRNTEGSGLGLAIAKSFVELQKGEFKIEVDGDLFKVIIRWPLQ